MVSVPVGAADTTGSAEAAAYKRSGALWQLRDCLTQGFAQQLRARQSWRRGLSTYPPAPAA